MEIDIGALGTNGGMKTDEFGRVISASGNIIDGLYTVGNAMAGSTGSIRIWLRPCVPHRTP